ncbi:teneurin-3-like [Diadema setosum]|uniref:teneurin-3-like n=1 Tax=Diadema setosum TaxID=31175 RepID=UPI003B3A7977
MAARGSVLAYSIQPIPQEIYNQQVQDQLQEKQREDGSRQLGTHKHQHQHNHHQHQHNHHQHRTRRHRQPHPQRQQQTRSSCSSSSQEEDPSQQRYGVRNGGYSSNETLRMSEVPGSSTGDEGESPTTTDTTNPGQHHHQLPPHHHGNSLCQKVSSRMEAPITEPDGDERMYYGGKDSRKDLSYPSGGNFDSALGSMDGSNSVSTSTMTTTTARGDPSHDQLMEEVDHYLHKQSMDVHSTGSHSTRSSLTLTETEMDHDHDMGHHFSNAGAINFDRLTSMPGYPPIGLSTYPHLLNGAFQGMPANHGRGDSLPANGIPCTSQGIVYHQLQPTNEDEEETTFSSSLPHSYSTGTGIYSSIKENQYNSIGDPNSLRRQGLSNTASQTLPGASGVYLQPRTGNIIHAVPMLATCDLATLHTTSTLATNSSTLNELNNPRHRQDRLFEYPLGVGSGIHMPVYPGAMCGDKRTGDREEEKYPQNPQKYTCKDHMSWRCLAVVLVLLTVALLALVTYFAVTLSRPMSSVPNQVNVDTRPTPDMGSGNPGNSGMTTRKPKRPHPPSNDIEITPTRGTTTPPTHNPAVPYSFGTAAQREIPPGQFWTLFTLTDSTDLIQFNLTLSRRSGFVVYGQRGRVPSHSFYDFMQVHVGTGRRGRRSVGEDDEGESAALTYHEILRLGGMGMEKVSGNAIGQDGRVKRSNSHLMHTWSFMEELQAGEWYIAVFNDGPYAEEVNLVSRHKSGWSCPGDCSGHGECLRGNCLCQEEYTGDDCSQGICPVLCSGRGQYVHGFCECTGGWKGPECNIPWDQCLVADCSSHGVCMEGVCVCSRGFTGPACEEEVLVDNTPHCNNDTDCFNHAQCISGMCHCLEGWSGPTCEEEECVLPCSPHGECVDKACICEEGWNGELCGLEGCPFGCSGHGSCQQLNDTWQCVCEGLYHGPGCSIGMETDCTDEEDNDGDFLIDCEDPDCCHTAAICIGDALCEAPPEPIEILQSTSRHLMMTPPVLFHDQVKFLIEPNSVHRSPAQILFSNDSIVSVVRGRVLTHEGEPAVGVRVQLDNRPSMGFTYTRSDGMFDLMVRGGGSISLSFARHPFITAHIPVYVPYNDFVLLEDLWLELLPGRRGVSYSTRETVRCEGDAYLRPEFVILPQAPMDSCGSRGVQGLVLDQQAVHAQVRVPSVRLSLDYYSQRAAVSSLPASLQARLTGPSIPRNLKLVHAVVTIAGHRFHDVLEPQPLLNYTFSWDKFNVYGQKVYGDEDAVVAIGYEYHTCTEVIWARQSTSLPGFNWDTAALAGWSLPMHHTYNPQKAILTLGDGCQVKYREQPPIIQTVMGNGRQRNSDCGQCEGKAKGTRILAPMAVASGPDGSYYVGDADYVRRVGPEGNVTSVLRLGYIPTYKYYMAVSPLDGKVYLSDSQMIQVFRLRDNQDVNDISNNVVVVAGTGQACPPVDSSECGNHGAAPQARLIAPKGIAVSKDGTVYLVDGTSIRKITTDGIIRSFLGTPGIQGPLRLPRCRGTMSFDQVKLQWPTEIAVNPLDDSVYVVDDDIIIRLGQDQRASVIAGVPYNCPLSYTIDLGQEDGSNPADISSYEYLKPRPANEVSLVMPSSIAFSKKGSLYVAETNHRTINRISKITSDGQLSRYAGKELTCDCLLADCDCFAGDKMYAMDSMLHGPIALTVMPNDDLVVADQGNLRLRRIYPRTPKHRVGRFHAYQIISPDREEIFNFDMYGMHITTRNVISEQTIFNISHSGILLDAISDAAGVSVVIQRNFQGHPTDIALSGVGVVLRLSTDDAGRLQVIQDVLADVTHRFGYHDDTELLTAQWVGQSLKRIYEYNRAGLLTSARRLNGEVVNLSTVTNSTLTSTTATLPWQTNLKNELIHLGGYVSSNFSQADLMDAVVIDHDRSTRIRFPNGLTVQTQSQVHPLMENEVEGALSKRKISLLDNNPHRLDWKFNVRKGGGRNKDRVLIVGRKLRVLGESVLSLEFNRYLRKDSILDPQNSQILEISYNNAKLPIEWKPAFGFILTNASYDSQGRLIRWQRDLLSEAYGYDSFGRLNRIQRSTNSTWRFNYQQGMLPTEIILPNQRQYVIAYDDAGHLATVTMPSGKRHFVNSIASVGYQRILYSDGNQPWLIVDKTESGLPLRRYRPGTNRRMAYVYDNKGRISEIYYDQTSIKYKYNRQESQVKLLELQVGDFQNAERLRYDGPLVRQKLIRMSGFGGFMNGRFDYVYDRSLRLVNIFAEFNTTILLPHNRAYDPLYGRLTQLGDFSISYPDVTLQNITDQNFHLTKKYGDYILLQNVGYKVRGVTVVNLQLEYNVASRIVGSTLLVGGTSHKTGYSYDHSGQLMEVRTDDTTAWQYTYDANGNLATVTHRQNTTQLHHNEFDRITRVGQIEYVHDEDGFLLRRGGERFTYDSGGQLVHAFLLNVYEVRYKYDGSGRRIWRKDHTGRQIQYFYADIKHPHRITHIYDRSVQEIWSYEYDPQGLLFAVKQQQRQLYVCVDQVGSPIAVFDESGASRKKVIYDPWGNVLHDSSPAFMLHVGFRGGLYDAHTKLVHFAGRDYDSLSGQWTSAGEHFYEDIAQPRQTSTFNLYSFHGNNPVNPTLLPNYLMTLDNWLPVLGYDMASLVPQIDRYGNLLHSTNLGPYQDASASPNPKLVTWAKGTWGFEQQAMKSSYAPDINFQAMPSKHFAGGNVPPDVSRRSHLNEVPVRYASLPTLLDKETLLAVSGERVLCQSALDVDLSASRVASVINNSLVLYRWHYSDGQREVRFLVKSGMWHYVNDLRKLGYDFNITDTSETVTFNVNSVSVSAQLYDAPYEHVVIALSNNYTTWKIFYGVSMRQAAEMVLETAREVAMHQAWLNERRILASGQRGTFFWTSEERISMLQNNKVPGYEGQYTLDPMEYPEIAFDGNNIKIVRSASESKR